MQNRMKHELAPTEDVMPVILANIAFHSRSHKTKTK